VDWKINPKALDAADAVLVAEGIDVRHSAIALACIEAYLDAAGFFEQRSNVVSDTQGIERRWISPWEPVVTGDSQVVERLAG
jgi:hypothetical protein